MLTENEEISERVQELALNLLYISNILRDKQTLIPEDYYVRNYTNILKSLIKIARFPLTNVKKLKEEVNKYSYSSNLIIDYSNSIKRYRQQEKIS